MKKDRNNWTVRKVSFAEADEGNLFNFIGYREPLVLKKYRKISGPH